MLTTGAKLTYKAGLEKKLLTVVFILFAVIYCLISLVNHYEFRTYALDLGIFNNALCSFAHFKANHFTADLAASHVNFLGDHFSPIVFLFAPLYYLFGSYTLLLVQIAFILLGGLGIYVYSKDVCKQGYVPLIITFQFFGIWGIYSALSFDFHANVIAAMLVPWLVYYHKKGRIKMFTALFVLILICKENMALWLVFIVAGLMLKSRMWHNKKQLITYLLFLVFALVYFISVAGYLMPYLQNGVVNYQLLRYGTLGTSLSQITLHAMQHPLSMLELFFRNQTGNPIYSGIKPELYLMVLASGGLAALFRPYYLVMLLPILAQKMLSVSPGMWGVGFQYSIEFVPILSLALADWASSFKSVRMCYSICVAYAVSTHISNIKVMDRRAEPFYNMVNTRFYSPAHYQSPLKLDALYKALHLIPPHVAVSAGSALVPHLANRDTIYTFPNVKDARYIALLAASASTTFPMDTAAYDSLMNRYISSDSFVIVYRQNKLLILKRK